MTLFVAACLAGGLVALRWWDTGTSLSPDGRFYLAAGRGEAVPRPYSRRWLLPLICGESFVCWQVVTYWSLVVSGIGISVYVPGEQWQRLVATGLLMGLPGLVRINVALPVLVDAAAFGVALLGAATWTAFGSSAWGYGALVACALVAGACKESAPVFLAAWTLNPVALVGLAAVGWWRRSELSAIEWLVDPVRAARKAHHGRWFDPLATLLPWGAVAVLAPLGVPHANPELLVSAGLSVAIAYGQLLQAQDRARLLVWAAPPLIAIAVLATPFDFALLVVVLHQCNPHNGL